MLQTPLHELPKVDEIGTWSLIKLAIINEYSRAYSIIMNSAAKKKIPKFSHVYIDAFSGAGIAKYEETGELVLGSPLLALGVDFKHYYFVELDNKKANFLKSKTSQRSDVTVEVGDCNQVLIDKVFPKIKWSDYMRGLCLFDPYGLHLNWEVILKAASSNTIEVFVNFPLMDINMNVLWRKNPVGQDPLDIERMNAFWGDESWREIAYETSGDLFGYPEKVYNANKEIAKAYRTRLNKVAGYKYVPEPVLMKNTSGGELYYLFFASHNKAGETIANDIFKKYKKLGLVY